MSMTTEELVARRVHINEQIDRLKMELDQINDKLREEFEYGKHEIADWTVSIGRNPQFQKDLFEQRFPVAQYPHFYKATPDTAALKKNFAPMDLEKFYAEGVKKVTIR